MNGNDRSESFKNYWISEPERTGAFLLTGSYAEENKTEVFYMYFIPKDSDNYTVSISTDNECNGFFSSLLSLQKPLTAQRTGNLVAMRTGDEAIHIDMLLSINFKTKK
ncbi:MAG TPA: hypothetical protein VFC68_06405 [Treponemataceae bacterium]|nr:hypothetical protein [Treponemataceae bacterium]